MICTSDFSTNLFTHWLRVSDSSTEEAVPLKATVQASPVVVPVASVGKTPRDESVELAIQRITG